MPKLTQYENLIMRGIRKMKPEIKQRIEQIKAGQVPDGYKKTKVGIVPSEWLYEKLEKFLIQHREISDYSNQYPVLTSSRKGIFLQSEYYNKEVASEDNTGYNVVPRGYFTYRHMSDDEIFKFNINNIVDKGIVSTLYPVFTTNGINDYFLQTVLNEGREFRRFAILQKQGGSRTYMYFDKLKQLKVCLPPLAEQEKIAKILSAQDKVIELKEKLLEEKKKQKKYLMQQFLTGKKRLPGFSRAWKEQKLKEFIIEHAEKTTITNQYPVLTSARSRLMYQTEYYTGKQVTTEDNVGYNVIPYGYITFRSRSDDGRFKFNKNTIIEKGMISYFYPVFTFDSQVDTDFMIELLNFSIYKKMFKYIEGTAQQVLSLKKLGNLKYNIPVLSEQRAISKMLLCSNKEISLLENVFEQEKQKKKALMQLLLTGIVRV